MITLTITAETGEELIGQLMEITQGRIPLTATVVEPAPEVKPEPAKAKEKAAPKAAPAAAPVVPPEPEVAPEPEAPKPAEKPKAGATLDDVRGVIRECQQKQADAKSVLVKYNFAKVSDITEDKLDAVIADLRTLL